MKLTKNDHGVYVATFKTPTGSKTVSTKCKDREEARKVAKAAGIEEMEMAAKAGRLTREVIGHITTGRKLTVAKAIEKWREWQTSVGAAPKSIINNLTVLNSWARELKLENLPPSSITEDHISKWVNADGDLSAMTRRVYLASIRGFFKLCSARGWVVGDPSMAVRVTMDNLTHDQKEPKAVQPFNKLEIKRLIKFAQDQGNIFWEFAIRISYEYGLRLGDICQMEWQQFAKAGKLIVWTDKRNKRVELDLSEEVNELVSRVPVFHHLYLFPEQLSIYKDARRRATLSTAFKRMCSKLGIEGRSFHSLRHTAATEKFAKDDKETLAKKLAETMTVNEIRQLLGHSSSKTTKGYIH